MPLISHPSYVGLAQHPQGPAAGMDHAAPRALATRPNAQILRHLSHLPEAVRFGFAARSTQRYLHRVRHVLAHSVVSIYV